MVYSKIRQQRATHFKDWKEFSQPCYRYSKNLILARFQPPCVIFLFIFFHIWKMMISGWIHWYSTFLPATRTVLGRCVMECDIRYRVLILILSGCLLSWLLASRRHSDPESDAAVTSSALWLTAGGDGHRWLSRWHAEFISLWHKFTAALGRRGPRRVHLLQMYSWAVSDLPSAPRTVVAPVLWESCSWCPQVTLDFWLSEQTAAGQRGVKLSAHLLIRPEEAAAAHQRARQSLALSFSFSFLLFLSFFSSWWHLAQHEFVLLRSLRNVVAVTHLCLLMFLHPVDGHYLLFSVWVVFYLWLQSLVK